MADHSKRLVKLEQRIGIRSRPRLSHARRKYLTDAAVRDDDQDALQELSRYAGDYHHTTAEQRSAALAAGLRADL